MTYPYVEDICTYVKLNFGKLYSVSGMTKWLHRNNVCHKKPHAVPAKANAQAQKAFVKEYDIFRKTLKTRV
ncbi:MAG: hypothetical protein GKR94_35030 [Gammaproteobacteria bacterium]|nr:hypothetical protein [Gammaproteobacteria bacterium]NKC17223.1 hypothetical protein [Gammaproteobacteria bacterium]